MKGTAEQATAEQAIVVAQFFLPRLGLSSHVPPLTGETPGPPVASFLTHYTCSPAVAKNIDTQANGALHQASFPECVQGTETRADIPQLSFPQLSS